MNKSALLMQQEENRNMQVYDPAHSLKLIADIVAPIVKSAAKGTSVVKKLTNTKDDKRDNSKYSHNPKVFTTMNFVKRDDDRRSVSSSDFKYKGKKGH